jgi:dTDP-4-dehydrorhamnose reductase
LHSLGIVILGAGGRLGAALLRAYRDQFDVAGFDHAQLDLGDERLLRDRLSALDFDVLVNCAALTNVDHCESHRDEAMRINAEAPRVLAEICEKREARLIHISTDYVFDGKKNEPYREEDPAEPISVYGESKRAGEKLVLAAGDLHLVVRVSWVFGPDRPSFIDGILKNARERDHVEAVGDKFSTPTYTRDIAEMLRDVVAAVVDRGKAAANPALAAVNDRGYNGILHLANSGSCSWQEYAQWALDCAHAAGIPLKARTVDAVSLKDMKNFFAKRPINSVLSTEKYQRLTGKSPRDWRDAVSEYVQEFYAPKCARSGCRLT